jgi:hypothetical protein
MTAPAAPRTPTPADLARRPAPKPTPAPPRPVAATVPAGPQALSPVTVADAIAPGKLTKREHFRKYYLFGLRASRMPAHARLVGHDLMWRASHTTGQIAPSLQPTIEALALSTGLTTGQVHVALQILHTRSWLNYRFLQAGPRTGQQAWTLTIPAVDLEQIRAQSRRRADRGIAP